MKAQLPTRPRLKESVCAQTVGDHLILLAEQRYVILEGQPFPRLPALLDGTRTLAEIIAALGDTPLPMLFAALARLGREGLLADGPPRARWGPFFDAVAGPGGLEAPAQVLLRLVGEVDPGPLEAALERAEVEVVKREASSSSPSPSRALTVVLTDDYLHPELDPINLGALERREPWLLARTSGVVVWVGPLVRPGQTACWRCLEQRLRTNREVERYLRRFARPASPRRASPPLPLSFRAAGASWVTVQILDALIGGGRPSLEGRLLTFDLVSTELDEHTVIRRPQCPACGSEHVLRQAPITLQSRPKVHTLLSSHRSSLPEETFERLRRHISPLTGVVTRLLPREDGSGLVNNHTAGHYFPLFEESVEQVQVNRYARSGAGGPTPAHARTSTLCEAIERYSGIYFGEEERIRASYRALEASAVHVRDLALYSVAQYARRAEINAEAKSNQQMVPDPLDEDVEISWTPAWSLTHGRVRHLPTSYCFYGFQDPGLRGLADSNGCAAGNNLEEAILHGLLELIERDAVGIWWYNRLRRPEVAVGSFDLPRWRETARAYEAMGRSLHVLDLRADLPVPVFGVVSRREGHPIEDITLGFAAHLDPSVALAKALAGAHQYLPSLEKRGKDGATLYRYIDGETLHFWRTSTFASEPYLCASDERRRARGDFEDLATPDVRMDLERCLDLLRPLGLEVLVVNQTRPDIGLPVVRVVVPGLRHFWRRLAPGRLYDVPVRLGWLDAPRSEDEMNPIACFV